MKIAGKSISPTVPCLQLAAGCSLLLAVFDVTREESLAAIKTWVATVTEWSGLKTQVGVRAL